MPSDIHAPWNPVCRVSLSKVNFGKILVTILGSFMILLGFLSVTGNDYNLFLDILATVYAYSANWLGTEEVRTVRDITLNLCIITANFTIFYTKSRIIRTTRLLNIVKHVVIQFTRFRKLQNK